MSLDEFKSKLSSIFYDQEIIFYCGWTKEASAAGRAEEFMNKGYTNVKVLGGGVGGWRNAGYEVIP